MRELLPAGSRVRIVKDLSIAGMRGTIIRVDHRLRYYVVRLDGQIGFCDFHAETVEREPSHEA